MNEVDGDDVRKDPLLHLERHEFLYQRAYFDDGLHEDGGDESVELRNVEVRVRSFAGLGYGKAGSYIGMPTISVGGVVDAIPLGNLIDCEAGEGYDAYKEQ